jgi:MATE family multidrug resistance protein
MSDTRPEQAQPASAAADLEARGWNRRIWSIAGPIILSNVSTPLVGAVDTAVMGQLPEPAYIGAVAVGAVIFNYLFWGFGFLRMGTTGFAAQAFGAGKADELRATLARPALLAIVIGLALILLQTPIRLLAFTLLDASDQVETLAGAYYDVRLWSAPAALLNYVMLGWLLALRRAGAVLALQVTLNLINVALDLFFVVGLGWGVEGVALASLLAEFGAMLLGFAIVAGALPRIGGVWRRQRVLDPERLRALFKVNGDILIRTLCLITAFAYLTAVSARMGDVILAANAVLLQFQSLTSYGLDGFAHAAEVLTGNAFGARQRRAFRDAVRVSGLWALALALLLGLSFALAGPALFRLFTGLTEVRAVAETYLPWLLISPLVSVWSYQLDGIFIGATRTAAMRNAMIVSLAIFFAACWALIAPFGNHGLWLAFTLFMAARGLTLAVFYPRLERSLGSL